MKNAYNSLHLQNVFLCFFTWASFVVCLGLLHDLLRSSMSLVMPLL
jgi:hypothetical protein